VGDHLATVVREHLGLGRAPVADIADLAEHHLGVDVAIWPVGEAVNGLCVHGQGIAMLLVNSSCSAGRERFSAAHELAHHLLEDPREILIETDIYDVSIPTESRANAFAAAFLLPRDGILEFVGERPVDASVLGELLRLFRVSYRALVWRLFFLRILKRDEVDRWLNVSANAVLRAAGDSNPGELTEPTKTRRIPTRLWRAALEGYQAGRVGIGLLAALSDEGAEILYGQLAAAGVMPPAIADDLVDI
jgi:Zn-dependent peptidase ImmA (M78 family)